MTFGQTTHEAEWYGQGWPHSLSVFGHPAFGEGNLGGQNHEGRNPAEDHADAAN